MTLYLKMIFSYQDIVRAKVAVTEAVVLSEKGLLCGRYPFQYLHILSGGFHDPSAQQGRVDVVGLVLGVKGSVKEQFRHQLAHGGIATQEESVKLQCLTCQ